MCRSIVQAARRPCTLQHARHAEHNVQIGGDATVFAPTTARRSSTIRCRTPPPATDFENFVKLLPLPCTTPAGINATVDIPVNKRT